MKISLNWIKEFIDFSCDPIHILESLTNLGLECNIINGLNIGPLKNLLKSINLDNLCCDKSYQFHGDFILDNINIV